MDEWMESLSTNMVKIVQYILDRAALLHYRFCCCCCFFLFLHLLSIFNGPLGDKSSQNVLNDLHNHRIFRRAGGRVSECTDRV